MRALLASLLAFVGLTPGRRVVELPPPPEGDDDLRRRFHGGWNTRRPQFMNRAQRRAWAARRRARNAGKAGVRK